MVKCARAMAGEGISREKILPLLAERRRHCALGNRQITDQELDGIAGWALDAEYGKQVFVRKAAA